MNEKKKSIKNIKKVAVALFFLGIIGMIFYSIYSFKQNEKLAKYSHYEFQISISPSQNIQLYDFQIYYDFIKEKGHLSFFMTKTHEVNNIQFFLPDGLVKTDFRWMTDKIDNSYFIYKDGIDYRIEKEPTPNLNSGMILYNLENLNKSNKTYLTRVEMDFKGKLYPNARFSFTPDIKIRPPGGLENGAFFKFNLENRYLCEYLCSQSYIPDLEFHRRGDELDVAMIKIPDGWKDVGVEVFYLNYNKINIPLLDFIKDISIALIFVGIVPSIEYILIKRKNKK